MLLFKVCCRKKKGGNRIEGQHQVQGKISMSYPRGADGWNVVHNERKPANPCPSATTQLMIISR